MRSYRVSIPPQVAEVLRHLPPAVKRDARQALRVLSHDPQAGLPLERELEGLRKYRIRSFRVVYRIATAADRLIEVVAVGPRATVYDIVRTVLADPTRRL